MTRRLCFSVLTVAVTCLGLAPQGSRASVVFTLGNNPVAGDENVLFNNGATGTTVFGTTNQSSTLVQFTSTQTLTEPASGAARIEATSGGSQVALTNFVVTVPGSTYTSLIFNPTITGTIGTPGSNASVTVLTNMGSSPFSYAIGNGNNYLTITTTGGERITSTSFSYSPGVSDLREVRIGGIAAVPEPGTLVTGFALTLVGVGGAVLRRKRAAA